MTAAAQMPSDTAAAADNWGGWGLPLLGGLVGGLIFLLLGGGRTLQPQNIAWLFNSPDPATHYLGWCFFRNSPWTWPPGANPLYGMAMGSSIVYSDSIPLMALLFKPFSPWLPSEFQYTGIWLLTCFCLQGAAAVLLARCVTPHPGLQLLIAIFIALPFPFLQRLNGHYALAAHWPLLLALWLYLRRWQGPGIRWSWMLLALLACLIHLYLAVMVLAIWHADLLRRWLSSRHWRYLREYGAVVACLLMTMWLSGYFVISARDTVTRGAAGTYGMNLLSPLLPSGTAARLPTLPLQRPGEVEGSAYLGLGVLCLVLLGLARAEAATRVPRWLWPLVVVLALLLLFAVTPLVSFGPWRLFSLPNFWGPLAELLRASGRMAWPAFYAVMVLILGAVTWHGCRRRAAAWLIVALLLQLWDAWPALAAVNSQFSMRIVLSRLHEPYWGQAAQTARHICFVPSEAGRLDWHRVARFAAAHGLSINYGYFARYSWSARVAADDALLAEVRSGLLRDDTIYIIVDRELARELAWPRPARSMQRVNSVDGLYILTK